MPSVWVYAAILVLAIATVALWYRPCEVYRTKVVVSHAEFGWTNTVCAPSPPKGCLCVTAFTEDPWTIAEWADRPERLSSPKQTAIPRVRF